MNRTTLTLLHTTITNNTSQNHASTGGHGVGGALEMYNSTLTMDNSILAGNHADTECTIDGAAGGANNIAGLGCPGAGDVDPMLGPLADNGGPTMTHELVDGSPAIGTANPDKCAPADQRSAPRPVGEGCDIGAFEFGGVVPPPAPDEIASTVSIRYRRIRHAFKGHVASDDVGCYSGRKVTLKRKVSGPDLSVKSALTNGKGNYKIAKRRVTGKTWYVVARRKPVGDTVLCTKERSLDLSIPHA
jgi:hypothetical protein